MTTARQHGAPHGGPAHRGVSTRGVLIVHSSPRALCPHVEWTVAGVLGVSQVRMSWTDQPAAPGLVRGECSWMSAPGFGAKVASGLRGWAHLRYEITEDASSGVDGARWCHTPSLGIFHSIMDAAGNTVVGEDRIKNALREAGSNVADFQREMDLLLGTAWDEELETFRYAGEGAPVRWLQAAMNH